MRQARGGEGGESQGGCQKKRKKQKEREEEGVEKGRGENARTKEASETEAEKEGVRAAQTLSCNVVKHPNRISNEPQRLLPICVLIVPALPGAD